MSTKTKAFINLIFKAVGLAMGVAVTVLCIIKEIEPEMQRYHNCCIEMNQRFLELAKQYGIPAINASEWNIEMGSDGVKKFNELKSSGILKKTRDWFYNEGGMFGDFDFDDDDFDAGFEIDSADSESGGDKSQPLSKDMMTDIAKKQTGAMYI